ncbi:hypothetical protein DICPUDRAFT_159300 [Dictyostelium purpureum]|uniref:Alcohol dehydrogenase iron-type/glycerol dehydrogenase GldA domain-containing protein n=1 Tax=Dictyostelium purpureum TaxID=5786 RepID=F1A3S4_DICPU|nr:uncharacterized protein DICPUDRAFT_159300 [Dictyostelium purpureum]EGC29151.1 hypothetical protein DICPUDRAFT_159300 [Dictyostelium purpureum]|eukprot:XP_003294318.1 hypothetical protein DICPUDRAFT_159300 [Dictyostelium purpureum]
MIKNFIHRSITSPKKFIIGKGLLNNPSKYIKDFGSNCFIICDVVFLDTIKQHTEVSLNKENIKSHIEQFNYQCTKEEVDRLCALTKKFKNDIVVGIGGGKTLDSAKAVAYYERLPVILMPTIASTDAPCTSLSVLYKGNGEFDKYLYLPQNPDSILVDTTVLINAPPRFFSAGVGDALATYFEARACYQTTGNNLVNMKPSRIGLGVSKMCYEIISDNIDKAMDAVKNKAITPAFEQMIEATIYLSGIGAESGGLAAAHAVCNGMSIIPDLHRAQHGEKVAFGLLTQLVLENAAHEEIENVFRIMKIANLPLTVEDLGLKNWDVEQWHKVASIANDKNDTMVNLPQKVDDQDIYNAMLTANEMGKRYKNKPIDSFKFVQFNK